MLVNWLTLFIITVLVIQAIVHLRSRYILSVFSFSCRSVRRNSILAHCQAYPIERVAKMKTIKTIKISGSHSRASCGTRGVLRKIQCDLSRTSGKRGRGVAASRGGTRNHRGVIRACKPTPAHASIRAVIGVS